jgi:hypothetical protein
MNASFTNAGRLGDFIQDAGVASTRAIGPLRCHSGAGTDSLMIFRNTVRSNKGRNDMAFNRSGRSITMLATSNVSAVQRTAHHAARPVGCFGCLIRHTEHRGARDQGVVVNV